MRQLDDQLLRAFMERLNAKLMDEARTRANECERGLEKPELGGLIIQKVGQGMAAAVEILSDILDQRIPGQVEQDAATALVDPAWRENMRLRWNAVAGLDLSQPRAGAAPPDSDAH
ncbi:MAG: hypothetical protein DI603_17925 [Roseateles depolymerans]|uniref:Uncharacterized protein n=1 Tax=Roseateles depolymerans TaxID=76731 RepID=A0A2W5DB60_9BURK|nr:MAG: hypothetical protein DI603_17925 [Roseateles depolymerans]